MFKVLKLLGTLHVVFIEPKSLKDSLADSRGCAAPCTQPA